MSFNAFLAADTIPNAAATGAGFNLNNASLVGIYMPATWTTAVITFDTSLDGVTWQSALDINGTEITVQAAQGKNHQINAQVFEGVQWLRVRSGTFASPVNQGGARVINFKAQRYS